MTLQDSRIKLKSILIGLTYFLTIPLLLYISNFWEYFENFDFSTPRHKLILPSIIVLSILYVIFFLNETAFQVWNSRLKIVNRSIRVLLLASGIVIGWGWIEFQSNPNYELGLSNIMLVELLRLMMFILALIFISKALADMTRPALVTSYEEISINQNRLYWEKDFTKQFIVESYLDEKMSEYNKQFRRELLDLNNTMNKNKDFIRVITSSDYETLDSLAKINAKDVHNELTSKYGWPQKTEDVFINYFEKEYSENFRWDIIANVLNNLYPNQGDNVSQSFLLKLYYFLGDRKDYNEYKGYENRNEGLIPYFLQDNSTVVHNQFEYNFEHKIQVMWILIYSRWSMKSKGIELYKNRSSNLIVEIEDVFKRLEEEFKLGDLRKPFQEIFHQTKKVEFTNIHFSQNRALIQCVQEYIYSLRNKKQFMQQELPSEIQNEDEKLFTSLSEKISSYILKGD